MKHFVSFKKKSVKSVHNSYFYKKKEHCTII